MGSFQVKQKALIVLQTIGFLHTSALVLLPYQPCLVSKEIACLVVDFTFMARTTTK